MRGFQIQRAASGTGECVVKLHGSALTDAQRAALATAASVTAKESYYLAGGAALALHLGHRRSVDLDWFRKRPMGDPLKVAKALTQAGADFQVTTSMAGTLHGALSGVKMSFLEYPYKMLEKPILWREMGCSLASLPDIACMKLSAIADRGAKKDFIDLYFMGQELPLERMLTLYQSKYGVNDIAHLIMSLAYFDDADRQRTPEMIRKVPWKTVKGEIGAWVRKLT